MILPKYSPLLIVTTRVIRDIARFSLQHPTIETAQDLLGLVFDDEETALVTTVIPPSPENIVRSYAHVRLGGEEQKKAVSWYLQNALKMRRNGMMPKYALPTYLHVSHSHHGLGYEYYSATDIQTIRKVVLEYGLKVAIGPLVTLKTRGPRIVPNSVYSRVPKVDVYSSEHVTIKWYYYSAKMAELGINSPVLVRPVIVEDKDIPQVPPLSWRYIEPEHYAEQMRHFTSLGCTVQVVEREIDGAPPFETQFLVKNPDWNGGTGGLVNIITTWDFPNSPPVFSVNKDGVKVNVELPNWHRGMDLVEVLFDMKKKGLI